MKLIDTSEYNMIFIIFFKLSLNTKIKIDPTDLIQFDYMLNIRCYLSGLNKNEVIPFACRVY